jgi:hypothetical protein
MWCELCYRLELRFASNVLVQEKLLNYLINALNPLSEWFSICCKSVRILPIPSLDHQKKKKYTCIHSNYVWPLQVEKIIKTQLHNCYTGIPKEANNNTLQEYWWRSLLFTAAMMSILFLCVKCILLGHCYIIIFTNYIAAGLKFIFALTRKSCWEQHYNLQYCNIKIFYMLYFHISLKYKTTLLHNTQLHCNYIHTRSIIGKSWQLRTKPIDMTFHFLK